MKHITPAMKNTIHCIPELGKKRTVNPVRIKPEIKQNIQFINLMLIIN